MDKQDIKREISELATGIKTQVDNFGEQVSKAELDELMQKIGKLHKKCSVLEHMNAAAESPEKVVETEKQPIITPAPTLVESEPAKAIITPEPVKEEVKETPPIVNPEPTEILVEKKEEAPKPIAKTSTKKMPVGINDKFQFIKELFAGDAEKYNAAMEKLNTISIQEEAELYFKSLQELNGWDEEADTVIRLKELLAGRFG